MGEVAGVTLQTELSLGNRSGRKADEAEALQSFEAYFVGELLRIAAPSNPSGLFDGGQAGRMYREHLYQEFARVIAENGGLGLATSLAGQLEKKGAGADDADDADDARARGAASARRDVGEEERER